MSNFNFQFPLPCIKLAGGEEEEEESETYASHRVSLFYHQTPVSYMQQGMNIQPYDQDAIK